MKSLYLSCFIFAQMWLPQMSVATDCNFEKGYWMPVKYIDALLESKANYRNRKYIPLVHTILVEDGGVSIGSGRSPDLYPATLSPKNKEGKCQVKEWTRYLGRTITIRDYREYKESSQYLYSEGNTIVLEIVKPSDTELIPFTHYVREGIAVERTSWTEAAILLTGRHDLYDAGSSKPIERISIRLGKSIDSELFSGYRMIHPSANYYHYPQDRWFRTVELFFRNGNSGNYALEDDDGGTISVYTYIEGRRGGEIEPRSCVYLLKPVHE